MCTGYITTTHYYYILSCILCAVYLLTPIFSFTFHNKNSCGSLTQSIMLYESTLPNQPCQSLELKQDTNLHPPIKLCYTNQHVDIISLSRYFERNTKINTVHHIALRKAKVKANNIAKAWADVWNQNILSPLAFKDGENVGSHFTFPKEPRLLNKIRMSTFLCSSEIGLHWE